MPRIWASVLKEKIGSVGVVGVDWFSANLIAGIKFEMDSRESDEQDSRMELR
jgi:hypothetical protein